MNYILKAGFTLLFTGVALGGSTLFEFKKTTDPVAVQITGAKIRVLDQGLEVRTGSEQSWPGITLKAPQGHWDLQAFESVTVDLSNPGDQDVTVVCRVDNPGADGTQHCLTRQVTVPHGERRTLRVSLHGGVWALSKPLALIGMRGYPGQQTSLDPAHVTQLLLFVNRPTQAYRFVVHGIQAEGQVTTLDADTLFPLLDEYGQFRQSVWPGKLESDSAWTAQKRQEQADLSSHPGPEKRTRYGGWSAGPPLEATGFFRVQKVAGQWWLVDPEGRLFWSHGVDCVSPGTSTPISDREHYFESLPDPSTTLGRFYGQGSWAPHGYYKDHTPYRTFDFGRANLLRKYGTDWGKTFTELTHRRLRSWGLNTIANWSDWGMRAARTTPYVGTMNVKALPIQGSTGYWGRFPDPFDPDFRSAIRRAVTSEKKRGIGDPWCLGYFVDNELAWGDVPSLALAALKSPADQKAKQIFVSDLTARYETIETLNAQWATSHTSWQALLEATDPPDPNGAGPDLRAFYARIAEQYFSVIREEFKRQAPHQLYLGCRFAWVNDVAAQAAARACDVITYNRYEDSVAEFTLPQDLDRPVLIGEFHFGALDRGLFHTGLVATKDQDDRAAHYKAYVQGALRNPAIVGTHWFQYRDQATTGRGDGENYQIGFLDICDTPYPELRKACREVGYSLYEYRQGYAR
ncbi:MAG: beta-agarase [Phycisphaeraceae bacterium]|nr:beta-agarase [Phycisphaeraceae bacterium]